MDAADILFSWVRIFSYSPWRRLSSIVFAERTSCLTAQDYKFYSLLLHRRQTRQVKHRTNAKRNWVLRRISLRVWYLCPSQSLYRSMESSVFFSCNGCSFPEISWQAVSSKKVVASVRLKGQPSKIL